MDAGCDAYHAWHHCRQGALIPPKYVTSINVREITKINLSGMTVDALMDLRKQIDEILSQRRAELEKQLERMGVITSRAGALRGRKVAPKYRGPSGETWAGRGARPRWLVDAIKGGKKLDDYLIDKAARKKSRKRRSKR